jgi:hypothetical protein
VLGGGARADQPKREDLGDHGGIFHGGDDRQGATTLGAVFQVDIEHPFGQPGPADAGRPPMWCMISELTKAG